MVCVIKDCFLIIIIIIIIIVIIIIIIIIIVIIIIIIIIINLCFQWLILLYAYDPLNTFNPCIGVENTYKKINYVYFKMQYIYIYIYILK